jgi:hypothetical protein
VRLGPLNPDAAGVTSLSELAEFIRRLRSELVNNRDGWPNDELVRYLEALADVAESLPQRFRNLGANEVPVSWAVVADMLSAAKEYE